MRLQLPLWSAPQPATSGSAPAPLRKGPSEKRQQIALLSATLAPPRRCRTPAWHQPCAPTWDSALRPKRDAAQNVLTHAIEPDTFRRVGIFLPPELVLLGFRGLFVCTGGAAHARSAGAKAMRGRGLRIRVGKPDRSTLVDPPTIPPVGTEFCRSEQVYDPETGEYHWREVCRRSPCPASLP